MIAECLAASQEEREHDVQSLRNGQERQLLCQLLSQDCGYGEEQEEEMGFSDALNLSTPHVVYIPSLHILAPSGIANCPAVRLSSAGL